MRILVLGSGAREHALSWRLGLDPDVTAVACAPGNAGIARTIDTLPLDLADLDATIDLAAAWKADLTVVGPEAPLAAGLADRFAAIGRPVFGPTRAAAQLETSKAFAKAFMERHGVPSARHRVCATAEEAVAVIRSGVLGEAVVVKADGLAAGKGVVVAPDRAAAEAAVRAAMVNRAFGTAGDVVVLEECLTGPEVSVFVVADGEAWRTLLTAQDHKRIHDNDEGPNTGGMGAFAPSPLVDAALQARIEREIVRPVLAGMAAEGAPFRGFLYCGLMLTADGPRVIEFNVRFGDPEAQVVLPLLDFPLAPLLMAAAEGNLGRTASADAPTDGSRESGAGTRATAPSCAVGVVLAAAGYPGEVRTGDRIQGLDHLEHECPDVLAFYAGVKGRGPDLITAGGRVLTLVARDHAFEPAIARAYEAVSRVRFDGRQYRSDIGRKALGPHAR
ncbi:MAG: phosphoribosylamine--glycine ligase [Vicinamibacterales bacterium]